MIALTTLLLLAQAHDARPAPSPALGRGFSYREQRGPKRRKVERRKPIEHPTSDVGIWTAKQRLCDREAGNCVMGPPDMVARHVRKPKL